MICKRCLVDLPISSFRMKKHYNTRYRAKTCKPCLAAVRRNQPHVPPDPHRIKPAASTSLFAAPETVRDAIVRTRDEVAFPKGAWGWRGNLPKCASGWTWENISGEAALRLEALEGLL